MEASAENMQALANYLTQTLSPEYSVRKPAEDYLMTVEKQTGYSILLLQLADSDQVDMHIRLAAAINFKNFVKRNWRVVEENKVGVDSRGSGPVSWQALVLCWLTLTSLLFTLNYTRVM